METPPFEVKRSKHPSHRFLVRGKVLGKWNHRYFKSKREALAFAQEQNAQSQKPANSPSLNPAPAETERSAAHSNSGPGDLKQKRPRIAGGKSSHPAAPASNAGEGSVSYLALSIENGTAGLSLQAPVQIDQRHWVRFENVESLRPVRGGRLRFRPLYRPAFLKIFRIVITRYVDGHVLYAARSPREFNELDVSPGAVKEIVRGRLVVVAQDQQYIRLPEVELPADANLRVEIEMESSSTLPVHRGDAPTLAAASAAKPQRAAFTQSRAPEIEGFSLNAIEFQTFEKALDYALTQPRPKARASDHGTLIRGTAVPCPKQ